MKHQFTIFGLVACLAISTLNSKEAKAECPMLPGRAKSVGEPQSGKMTVLMLNHGKHVVVYVTKKGDTPIDKCYPTNLNYDRSKLSCKVKTYQKDLDRFELESNYRIFCESKVNYDTKTTLSFNAQGYKEVEIWSFQSDATLLAVYRKLARRMKDLEERMGNNEQATTDAYDMAVKAKKRVSANMALSIDFYYTFYHQGADIRYYGDDERFWPSGGIGLGYSWWFKTWSKDIIKFKLGVTTRLRWHRLVLTIDGAPQDDDVPGDQYEMLLNLHGRLKVGKWVSFDLYLGMGPGLFHHQDQISQQNDAGWVEGPEHNVSFNWIFNMGGGINLHLGQFVLGLNLMGALDVNALLHPDFQGSPRYGTAKHLYFGLKAEYNY